MEGAKTYTVAILMIIYGVLGYFLNYQDASEAGKVIMEGFAFIFLRMGLSKAIEQTDLLNKPLEIEILEKPENNK